MPNTDSAPVHEHNLIARIGRAMQRHQRVISIIQWATVALYIFFLLAPTLLPLPDSNARIMNDLRLFSQFLFWGIGWPLVMLSMMLLGRVWCGIFCPDGTLTEFVSRRGRNRSIPRWMRWPGWPCTMLLLTTLYGQLVGVYDFHPATLLLLGLPTLAAIWCGLLYGNGKRIWCMYLCPANGVFGLLAKISPLHFQVNEENWKKHPTPLPRVDCPPLIDIRRMRSASACHACGRCGGYLDAVELAARKPDAEILQTPSKSVHNAEAITLIFGILGVGTAATQWSGGVWFLPFKSVLAKLGLTALQQYSAPWWLLANYPAEGRVFSLFDGLALLLYLLGGGALLGGAILAMVWLATKIAAYPDLRWQKLSLALIPIAGIGIFLGLSSFTVSHLQGEGVEMQWVPYARAGLLLLGGAFSLWLGARLILARNSLRSLMALIVFALPAALMCTIWMEHYFK
jgi:polyferredoxin